MGKPQWTVQSGYTFQTIQERTEQNIPLPIESLDDVTISVISGSLPPGLRIADGKILGSAFEVARDSNFKTVVRATNPDGIADITFNFNVEGPDTPVWSTAEGLLPVGPNNSMYVVDSSLIDFQLQAVDPDLPTGETLRFYIAEGDGELPKGLTLSESGRITGVVDPIRALDVSAGGGYDMLAYDAAPIDFTIPDGDGYDSYYYDTVPYGKSVPTRIPRKLNRRYQFRVTVQDSVSKDSRIFQIYVVGDDFARADNTIMKAGNGVFKSDFTYLRDPIWITPSDLGFRRANNYQTIYLDTLDPIDVLGRLTYILLPFNSDGTESVLPNGMSLDGTTGEIAGRIGYQPAVTREYKFTIEAIRIENDIDYVTIFAGFYEDTLKGQTFLKINKLKDIADDGVADLPSLVGRTVDIGVNAYTIKSVDATNELFDIIELTIPLLATNAAQPLTIKKEAIAGQSHLFVNTLTQKDRDFYLNREFIYSDTESYKVFNTVAEVDRGIWPYVEYRIYTNADELELNYSSVDYGDSTVSHGDSAQKVIETFVRNAEGNVGISRPVYILEESLVDPAGNYAAGPLTSETNGPYDRSITVNGIKIVGSPAIGGATANSDEFIKKVAKVFQLLMDPNDGNVDSTKQNLMIETLKGNAGNHIGFPTVQRVGYNGPSAYSPSIVDDDAPTNYPGLGPFLSSVAQVDYIWEFPNGSGGQNDTILEVLEHAIHTLTQWGAPGTSTALANDNQTSDLYNAMQEARTTNGADGNPIFDSSVYSGDFAGDPDFRALLMREYIYLLIIAEWGFINAFTSGTLAPEWNISANTASGVQTYNPLGHNLYINYIRKIITKPLIGTLQDIFQNDNLGLSGYTPDVDSIRSIKFAVPEYANTTNTNLVKGMFNSVDSSAVLMDTPIKYDRVKLETALASNRSYDVGNTIEIGLLKNDLLQKTVRADKSESSSTSREFSLKVQGEIDSVITWVTATDLGTVLANRISDLKLTATSTVKDPFLQYYLTAGSLPNGLSLLRDGEIVGTAVQFGAVKYSGYWKSLREYTANEVVRYQGAYYKALIDHRQELFSADNFVATTITNPGLSRFELGFGLDGSTTSIDKKFTFTVLAKDRLGYSAIARTFTLRVQETGLNEYSNLYMQPFINTDVKNKFLNFMNEDATFTPDSIYRPSDKNFGIQKSLRALVYAGIQTKSKAEYVGAIAKNSKKKKYKLGSLQTAIAKREGTTDTIYEVVYINLIDPGDTDSAELNTRSKFKTISGNEITVDGVNVEVANDASADTTVIKTFSIIGRAGVINVPTETVGLPVTLRTGEISVPTSGVFLTIFNRDGTTTVIEETTSSTIITNAPQRFRPINSTISVDSDALLASQSQDVQKYISNITNLRNNIATVGSTENSFLPLWMRTQQTVGSPTAEYQLAIPLVFCKPGTSSTILSNIKNYFVTNTDFKLDQINYEIDRLIIDSVEGQSQEQHLVFENFSFNV